MKSLKKGHTIKIKGKEFQIVEDWDKDFTELPDGETKWFNVFGLIELSSKKMTITHWLKISENLKEIYLIHIGKNKKEKLNLEDIS